MITWFMLLAIGVLSVGGIYYIYREYEHSDNLKKAIVVLLIAVVVLTTVFMIVDVKTRDVAVSTGQQSQATLAILLGFSEGGYSPYIKETWGGTGPEQDFDLDGIKNKWDADADNDGVEDHFEPPTRFNPYQPDVGIKDLDVRWLSEDEIQIKAVSVDDIVGTGSKVTLYVNDNNVETKTFTNTVYFTVNERLEATKIELRVEGMESEYANKANNVISYTIPASVTGEIGVWYSNLETDVQGVIRNNPLFYADNGFSYIENLFRGAVADVPLFIWVAILTLVVIVLIWYVRRMKKGKGGLLDRFRKKKKKKEYPEGTTKIKVY